MVAGGDDGASIPGVSCMVRTRLVERVRGEASATCSEKLNAVNGSGDGRYDMVTNKHSGIADFVGRYLA